MNAYVTLLYSPSYLAGALVLSKSLEKCNSANRKVVMIPRDKYSDFNAEQISVLNKSFDELLQVDSLATKSITDLHNLNSLLERPELKYALTKLQVFQLEKYSKLIYLDSDFLVLQNLDHLFDIDVKLNEIWASPDCGWPDIFNSGFFLIKPSTATFYKFLNKINDSEVDSNSFDGADQGFLNEFFQNLGRFNIDHKNVWQRLPFVYNVTPSGQYQYLPAYKRFASDVKCLHYIGVNKPWTMDPTTDSAVHKLWWSQFYSSFGADATLESVTNTRNEFAHFKAEKFDPSSNFAELTIDDSAQKNTTEAGSQDKEAEKSILDVMFRKDYKASRVFKD